MKMAALNARSALASAFLTHCMIASATNAAPASHFGVLSQSVATGGTLIAAAGALSLCWKGRFNWEPVEEDVPRASQRVAGLLIAIAIAIVWYRFSRRTLYPDDLMVLSAALGAGTMLALLCYGLLVGVLVYDKKVGAGGKETRIVKIIGGFRLTPMARMALSPGELPVFTPGKPPVHKASTIADLLKGAGNDPDRVWTRLSRALAKVVFQLAYVTLVGCGTCALATISMLLATSI